jgi:hypothetical protein
LSCALPVMLTELEAPKTLESAEFDAMGSCKSDNASANPAGGSTMSQFPPTLVKVKLLRSPANV